MIYLHFICDYTDQVIYLKSRSSVFGLKITEEILGLMLTLRGGKLRKILQKQSLRFMSNSCHL